MKELLDGSVELWRDCGTEFPRIPREYSDAEQLEREAHLDEFLTCIEAELRRLPCTRAERTAARERITSAFREFSRRAMDLREDHLTLLLQGGFSAIGRDLGRQARRFDPDVEVRDIIQACRNAWTACGLQALMTGNMRVTASIFAYSMLYPYSDNYMDEPTVAREAKLSFSERFRARLRGEAVAPDNDREALIWRLISLIESEWARRDYPLVFEGLLAIHHAQEESLRLLRGGNNAVDVVALCFAKGGASVLADARLAGGSIGADMARFAFEWGVLLQLADDLQDVRADRERGMLTLFSNAAETEPLDAITNRTLRFGERVLAALAPLGTNCEPLKELIGTSSYSLLIRSAGEAGELYSKAYLARIERHSPFHFRFWRERRAQLTRRSGALAKLFEAFLAGEGDEPAFPWLPNSLLPVS